MSKSYTVIPHNQVIPTAWNAKGNATACRVLKMPERTFASLKVANCYVRLCKSKGFSGVRVNNLTGAGTFF